MTNEQIQKEIDLMKERVRLLEELRKLQAQEQELTNRSPRPLPPAPPPSRFWYGVPASPIWDGATNIKAEICIDPPEYTVGIQYDTTVHCDGAECGTGFCQAIQY